MKKGKKRKDGGIELSFFLERRRELQLDSREEDSKKKEEKNKEEKIREEEKERMGRERGKEGVLEGRREWGC